MLRRFLLKGKEEMAITFYHPQWAEGRTIQGVLFDLDGLVLDSERLYTRFWREAAAFYGYDMSLEQALGMRSRERENGIRRIKSYFGADADYVSIRQKRIELMDAFLTDHVPEKKPGIFELLDVLRERNIPAAITSSAPLDRIETYLAPHGLYTRFQAVCSARQVAKGKPAPVIYLFGAKSLGVDPKNCIALEDSPTGIEAAFQAGCLSILIPDQDDASDSIQDKLYGKADSLLDIISLLK